MKILFIQPPPKGIENINIPLGISYLASIAKKESCDVKILDLSAEPEKLNSLINRISKYGPDVVGISCNTVNMPFVEKISELIKKKFDTKIIVGGPHPTALPEETLKIKEIDAIVIGEGESTLQELINKKFKFKGVRGIFYRDKNKIVKNKRRELIKNLDEIPFPSFDLLPYPEKYRASTTWEFRKPFANMISSRGCFNNCIFCASKSIWGQCVRFRSAPNILSEIKYLKDNYKVREIIFVDDNFLLNFKRLKEICNGIIREKLDVTWGCIARVDCINKELLKLMKKAGCHMINFGVESGNAKILKIMRKNYTVEQVKKAFAICKELKIGTKASFIFGSPGETYKSVQETIKLSKELNPDYVFFSSMTPLHGTDIYRMYEKSGMLSKNWKLFDQVYGTPEFYGTSIKGNEIRNFIKKAYLQYYFRIGYLKNMNLKKISFATNYFKRFFTFNAQLKNEKF